MTRDERDEWPADEPIGSFDIEDGTIEGYPGATAHLLFVCPNDKRCAVLLGPSQVARPTPDALWHGFITAGVMR